MPATSIPRHNFGAFVVGASAPAPAARTSSRGRSKRLRRSIRTSAVGFRGKNPVDYYSRGRQRKGQVRGPEHRGITAPARPRVPGTVLATPRTGGSCPPVRRGGDHDEQALEMAATRSRGRARGAYGALHGGRG